YDFFKRAVVKYAEYEKKKKARSSGQPAPETSSQPDEAGSSAATPAKDDTLASDVEGDVPSPGSSAGRKRKREDDDDDDRDQADSPDVPPSETQSVKRAKEDEAGADVETPTAIPSPPTPPPPPMETPLTEEERSMREQ